MADNLSMKLEILRMAREIVNNEYTDKRAQDHNKWLADSEKLATRGIKVPYPDIPAYPDESVVIAKAKSLLSFVGVEDIQSVHPLKNEETVAVEPVKQVEPVNQVEPTPSVKTPKLEKAEAEEVKEEKIIEPKKVEKSEDDIFREYIQKKTQYELEDETTSSSRMISMLNKQLNDLKKMMKA